jgi:predicted N-acetyltransferase YhbS
LRVPTVAKRAFRGRAAQPADAQGIRALIRLVRIHGRNLDWQRFLVVTASDGMIIGCCQVKERRAGVRELASVAVHPDWRGRGVSIALSELLRDACPRPLWGICLASMASFYERFGGRIAGAEARRPWSLRLQCHLLNAFFRLRGSEQRAVVMLLE